jgi:hypothetical protein
MTFRCRPWLPPSICNVRPIHQVIVDTLLRNTCRTTAFSLLISSPVFSSPVLSSPLISSHLLFTHLISSHLLSSSLLFSSLYFSSLTSSVFSCDMISKLSRRFFTSVDRKNKLRKYVKTEMENGVMKKLTILEKAIKINTIVE